METIHEIIPFAKEMLSQKPSRHMVKVYLAGSAMAFLGVALGLVETVCQPFSAEEPLDEELARLEEREQRLLEAERQRERTEGTPLQSEVTQPKKEIQQAAIRRRSSANRLHAS
ncbi:G0/G1 switch protein 2-like [Anguilla rostrata]|uniref:G0/G1 switch protein 2-like n=1 Tax=Anguilla rostrata TaxID=7938 RepID=UPI0030CD03D4